MVNARIKAALLAPVMCAALALGFSAGAPAPEQAHADEPSNGFFNILTEDQKLALTVDGDSAANGSVVSLEPEDVADESQKFQLTEVDGGLYEVTAAANSDLALDVDGSGVQVWTKTGQSNQRFMMAEGADGSVKLIPASNATSALTLAPGEDGTLSMTGISLFNRTDQQAFFLRAANLPGMEYTEACVGDKLVYSITQQVNELGVNAFVRYQSMKITDTLPEGLNYVSAKLYSEKNVDLTSKGKLTYDQKTRLVTFQFGSSYLKSGMSLKGEKYRLEITTSIASIPSGNKFDNTGYTTINDTVLTSNKVTTPIYAPNLVQGKSVYNKSTSRQTYVDGVLQATPGDVLHYTITVDQSAKGAVQPSTDLVDEIPDELKLDSGSVKLVSGNTASVASDGKSITVNTGRLVYGDQIKVEYDCVLDESASGKEVRNAFGPGVLIVSPGPINYYRDGESSPVYVDKKASYSDVYQINPAATSAATRSDCAGLDGWYLDKECTVKYEPAVNGKPAGKDGFSLYAKNRVTVDWQPTDNSYFVLNPTGANRAYYLDASERQAITLPAAANKLLPTREWHYYGDTVSFVTTAGGSRGASVWYNDMGQRELSAEKGVYGDRSGTGTLVKSAKLVKNTTVYVLWRGLGYDGVYAGK